MKVLELKQTTTVRLARSILVRVVGGHHGCALEHSEEVCASRSRTVRINEPRDVKPRGGSQE